MTEEKKILFKEYSDLVVKIKSFENRKEELGKEIFGEMVKLEVEQVQSDFGTFYFLSRKTWEYPSYVKEAEMLYKNKKKEAETKGDATFEEKKSLAYRAKE